MPWPCFGGSPSNLLVPNNAIIIAEYYFVDVITAGETVASLLLGVIGGGTWRLCGTKVTEVTYARGFLCAKTLRSTWSDVSSDNENHSISTSVQMTAETLNGVLPPF